MDMGAMFMDGVPSVIGAGNDSNNYLDQRNEGNVNDQGTLRGDHIFPSGDSLSLRYSAGAENGCVAENLPGFGLNHDNLSQNAGVVWTRVITPLLLNTASI